MNILLISLYFLPYKLVPLNLFWFIIHWHKLKKRKQKWLPISSLILSNHCTHPLPFLSQVSCRPCWFLWRNLNQKWDWKRIWKQNANVSLNLTFCLRTTTSTYRTGSDCIFIWRTNALMPFAGWSTGTPCSLMHPTWNGQSSLFKQEMMQWKHSKTLKWFWEAVTANWTKSKLHKYF